MRGSSSSGPVPTCGVAAAAELLGLLRRRCRYASCCQVSAPVGDGVPMVHRLLQGRSRQTSRVAAEAVFR
jgi:hypothetical protein